MSKVLTSLGVSFLVGSSSNWGSMPTIFYKIPQIIENSEIDLDPDAIDTTSYDNLRYKSSASGLIDTSGIMSLTANATQEEDAETVWDNAVDEYEQGKQIWLCTVIPHKREATYMPIIPIRTGAYNTVVNDRITIKLKYTIAGDLEFFTAPIFDSYKFKDAPDTDGASLSANLQFISYGNTIYNSITVDMANGEIKYDALSVYNRNSGWIDEKYKIISVSPAYVSEDLAGYLSQNATEIHGASTIN